jgi:hypothetical protein
MIGLQTACAVRNPIIQEQHYPLGFQEENIW